MSLEREPFRLYHLDNDDYERPDTFTVRLNYKERELLNSSKKILEQKKDSTVLKQLAWIGAKVLHDQSIGEILQLVFKNKRKNKRVGVADFE